MKTHSRLHRNTLARAHAFVLFAPSAVLAQSTATQPAAPSAQAQPTADAGAKQLDKVTVTGSRIKRAEIEGPAPVTIVTAEQIKKEGFTTVYDALSTFTEAMGTVESDIRWGQHTVNASPLNLRNLGPGRSINVILKTDYSGDEVNEEKDPFKKDFAFIQDRIFSPVGREFSVEFAYKFN